MARRKAKELTEERLASAGWVLNPSRREVTAGGATVRLTVKESLILELLMRNHGLVVSKERILEKVWGYCTDVEPGNVELYIHYLRKKLDTSRIKTIRGVGYLLEGD